MSEQNNSPKTYGDIRYEALNRSVIRYQGVGEGVGGDDFTHDMIEEVIDASPLAGKVTFLWNDGMYYDSKYKYDNSDELFEIFHHGNLAFNADEAPEEWVDLVRQILITVDDDSIDVEESELFGPSKK